ncbi:MAG: hypothetical protein Q9173_000593 [Seirophora scorigena]
MSLSPSQSLHVQDPTARRSIKDYGDFRYVASNPQPPSNPALDSRQCLFHTGSSPLLPFPTSSTFQSPSDTLAYLVCPHLTDESQYRELSRQSSITPPPDHAAIDEQARQLEKQSRKALVDAGCPPCYPSDLAFPLRNVPEKYEIVSYWQSIGGTGHAVLTPQLSDWKASCDYQKRNRRYYVARGTFPVFVDRVRDRRRRHGLQGDVYLLPEPEEQDRLQNWVEFQNYHLEHHECEERELKVRTEKWNAARKISAETLFISEAKMKISERKLEEHSKMLRWIEQQREIMVTEQVASIHTIEDHNRAGYIPLPTFPGLRKKKQKSRSLFDPVRSAVTKEPWPKQKSLRPSTRNSSQPAKDATTAPMAPPRSKRTGRNRDKLFRHDVESTPLHRPQSVARAKVTPTSKSSQPLSTNIDSRWQQTSRSKRHKLPQKLFPSRVTKTRSGREIRKPRRLGFDPDK